MHYFRTRFLDNPIKKRYTSFRRTPLYIALFLKSHHLTLYTEFSSQFHTPLSSASTAIRLVSTTCMLSEIPPPLSTILLFCLIVPVPLLWYNILKDFRSICCFQKCWRNSIMSKNNSLLYRELERSYHHGYSNSRYQSQGYLLFKGLWVNWKVIKEKMFWERTWIHFIIKGRSWKIIRAVLLL